MSSSQNEEPRAPAQAIPDPDKGVPQPQISRISSSTSSNSTSTLQYGHTHRALKSRHVQLLAIGGGFGTGLFLGTGATLSIAGGGSLFFAYCAMSMVLWCVMNSLAEMTTYLPVEGTSVPYYVNRFLDPSLAFACGWNYWYAYAILLAAEVSAASVIVEYWSKSINPGVWITVILVLVVGLNIFAAGIYGESEFWFASIKIVAILGLIILGVVLFFGGGPNHDRLGFRYWQHGLAFKPYQVSGAIGRFLGFWTAVVRSGFAFVFGPELITIAAGESADPRRNIPKAGRRFVYRLMVFYIMGTLVISVIVPSEDPSLLQAVNSGTADAGASPFVLGIQRAGIPVLNHIINAAILTSAASAGNSFLFAGSRNLYSLAVTGQAPAIFKTCNKQGVPYYGVLATAALGSLSYLSISAGSATVFTWFLNLATISGFIGWILLLLAYVRFRKAMILQGRYDTRPYRTSLQPYTTYFAVVALIIITLSNGFQVFFPGNFTVASFLAAYVTLPLFLALYLGHKAIRRTPWARKVKDIDVVTGLDAVEEIQGPNEETSDLGCWRRVWHWVA